MNDEHITESDVSDESGDAPEASKLPDLDKALNPTADVEISGDIEGREPGFTFPGPGA